MLDGLGQTLFAVSAVRVNDRLGDARRAGGSQVLVGSAPGPNLISVVVDRLGYLGTFGVVAAVRTVATPLVVALVRETLAARAGARGTREAFVA